MSTGAKIIWLDKMNILNKLLILLACLIIIPITNAYYPAGCSTTATDYIWVDSINDTDNTLITAHTSTYANTAYIPDAWLNDNPSPKIVDNVMIGDGQGNNGLRVLKGWNQNWTLDFMFNIVDLGQGINAGFKSGSGYLCSFGSWFPDSKTGWFIQNSSTYAAEHLLTAGDFNKWYRVKMTLDNGTFPIKCWVKVYDSNDLLIWNTSVGDSVKYPSQFGTYISNDGVDGKIDNITLYSGDTCPTGILPAPVISNQRNYTNDNLTWTFQVESDSNGQCSLWGNWSGSWAMNESKASTAATALNFTDITFGYNQNYKWGVNCSSVNGETWGNNYTFNTQILINPPIIVSVNLTSEGIQTAQPFVTNDTTPTFAIQLDRAGACNISIVNETFDTMPLACSMTGGGYQTTGTCTLDAAHAINPTWTTTGWAYIGCTDSNGLNNTLPLPAINQLNINVTAIDTGSVIGLANVNFRAINSTQKGIEPVGQDASNPAFRIRSNGTACAGKVNIRNNATLAGTDVIMECSDNYGWLNAITVSSIPQVINESTICGGQNVAIFCRLNLTGQTSGVTRRALFELITG